VVADWAEEGAMPYNPAILALHSGTQGSTGVVGINSGNSVTNAAGTSDSDTSNPSILLNGFFESGITGNWRWGVAFDTPFGQQTNWPAGSFPAFAGPIAGLAPTLSKIKLVRATPMIGAKFGTTGIGVGVDYYRVLDANFNSQALGLSGNGDAFGWSVGLLHSASPWSFGIAYRSAANVRIDGSVSTPVASAPASAKLNLPAILQGGVRLDVSPAIAIEIDLDWTQWSRFDVLTINHSNPGAPSPLVSTNNWRNTVATHVGMSYRLGDDTTLRLGYTYDPSAVPDAHFSARTPDPMNNSFSAGIGQRVGDWQVDAGYLYVRYSQRTFATNVPFGTYGLDPNGTAVFNGTYNSKAQLFALNFTKRF
jgi:long-chain fatty acid transport protein